MRRNAEFRDKHICQATSNSAPKRNVGSLCKPRPLSTQTLLVLQVDNDVETSACSMTREDKFSCQVSVPGVCGSKGGTWPCLLRRGRCRCILQYLRAHNTNMNKPPYRDTRFAISAQATSRRCSNCAIEHGFQHIDWPCLSPPGGEEEANKLNTQHSGTISRNTGMDLVQNSSTGTAYK